ncbi:hypothetical protein P691DRAFT_763606 [Macrolepiota fuliginosa MF-IS2]|uniref:Uncharacterized protein n=1 Tax=Macrolepiota fuliginosa MF-IS2 TaxID=1400762 RepID=A0A9P5X6D6_9AGAR|nr:hypothetical protein P691DRAFT_763606 [Macrolepiota fuliginosa MF-IS2]
MSSPESKKLPSLTEQKDTAAHDTPLTTNDTSTSHTSHETAIAGIIGGAVAGSESDACATDACAVAADAAADGGGE